MTDKEALKADVEKLGEVHAKYEEHDGYLEIRKGQVEWDEPSPKMFTLEVPTCPPARFYYDRIVDWKEPDEMWHG